MKGLQVSISLLLCAISVNADDEILTIVPQKAPEENIIDVNDVESIEASLEAFDEAALEEEESLERSSFGEFEGLNDLQRSISVTDSNHRFSVNGGFRLTVEGGNFLPSDWDIGVNGAPTALIYKNNDDSINFPCEVITHFLAPGRLVCDVKIIPLSNDLLTNNSNGNYKVRIFVDGISIGTSSSFRFTTSATPKINHFEQNGPIVPGDGETVSGQWTSWFNNDVTTETSTSESETIEDLIASGQCNRGDPLKMEVRNVATGIIYSNEELEFGFNDCFCTGNTFQGFKCAVPSEDSGKYFCTADHEVRYYCSSANVIGFAFKDNGNGGFDQSPGLYSADGIKYASCDGSSFGETVFGINPSYGHFHGSYDFHRCQITWSGNPSVGNYNFKYGTEDGGYSASSRNSFLGSDGNLYNVQVRPQIDSISPSEGANTGGTKITIIGQNLDAVTDIRVGGVKCNHVTPSANGLTATCITEESVTCSAGDDPVSGVNCATYTSRTSISGDFDLSNIYTHDWYGAKCATGCEKSGSAIKCLNTAGSTQYCYVPNCERYTRKYPGSPGLSYTWKQNYGSLNRWYYLVNHFGVETNFGTPADQGTDIFSNTYYGKEMRHKGNGQAYIDQGLGFFKPPVTGYYSPIVSTCDDYCSFQISAVGNVGCPADLRTHGYSDHHDTRLLGRVTYTSTYRTQEKIFLDSSEQYYVNLHHYEGGGEDWAEFGFIYHGSDPNENLNHAGFTKEIISNTPELNNAYEELDLIIENDGDEEIQELTKPTLSEGETFKMLICPDDNTPDSLCTETTDLTSDMTNDDIKAALMASLESECMIQGEMETTSSYNNMESHLYWEDGTDENYDTGSFCGGRRVAATRRGSDHLFFWNQAHSDIYPERTSALKIKNAEDICFAVKGHSTGIIMLLGTQTSHKDYHTFWHHLPNGFDIPTSTNSWTFGCLDMVDIIQAMLESRTSDFTDPADFDPLEVDLYQIRLRDYSNPDQSEIFVDEVYIGKKNSQFNVQQTRAGAIPGLPVKSFDVSDYTDENSQTFQVQFESTDRSCNEGVFSKLRIKHNDVTTRATKISSLGNGLSGSFDVLYKDSRVTIEMDWMNQKDLNRIKDELSNHLGSDLDGVSVNKYGECHGQLRLHIKWNKGGDYADLTIDPTSVVADNLTYRTRQRKHGGVIFRTITDAHLSQAFDTPQVQAWSSDVQAVCTGDCSFSYSDTDLPSVTSVTSSDPSGLPLTISGTNFIGANLQVLIGQYFGTIDTSSETQLEVSCPKCLAGVYQVNVLNDKGKDSDDVTHMISETIASISATTVNTGDVITITGSSLSGENAKIGSSPCLITSATPTVVECIVTGPSQTANLQVGTSNSISITVTNNGPTCTIDDSYSPAFVGDIVVTCDSMVTNPRVFVSTIENTDIGIDGNDITFKKTDVLAVGTHDIIIIGDGSSSTFQLSISYSVDSITNTSGGRLGSGLLTIGGVNLDGLSVKIGNRDCEPVTLSSTSHVCRVPPHDGAVKSMSAGTRSIGSGLFEPSTVTIEVGSRVDFSWNIFMNDGSYPSIHLNVDSNSIMPSDSVPSNIGSGHFVFMSEGTFTISTGLYDGVNEITGTITVTASSSDLEVSISVMMGDDNVDLSAISHNQDGCSVGSSDPSLFKYSFSETHVYDSITVAADSVIISGYSTDIPAACIADFSVSDSSCSLTESISGMASCQLTSAGVDKVYLAVVDNIVSLTSAVNTVSFTQEVSDVLSEVTISSLGGSKVIIGGANLKNTQSVKFGDSQCVANNVEYQSGIGLIAFYPTLCTVEDTNINIYVNDIEYQTSLNVVTASGTLGDVTLISAIGDVITVDFDNLNLVDGTYKAIAASSTSDNVAPLANSVCTDAIVTGGSASGVECTFGLAQISGNDYFIGLEVIGYLVKLEDITMKPVIESISVAEGSHGGQNEITITGSGLEKTLGIEVTLGGVDICTDSCGADLQDDGVTIKFTIPASGVTGDIAASVAITLGTATSDPITYTYRDSLTPVATNVVRTGDQINFDVAGLNGADCTTIELTVGGVDCPIVTCDSTTMTCSLPDLVSGDHDVILNNPNVGMSTTHPQVTIVFSFDSFSPSISGIVGGGALIIEGEGIDPASTVTVCGDDCIVNTVRSTPSSLVCKLPAQIGSGSCEIILSDPSRRKRRSDTNLGSITFDDSLTAEITNVASSNIKIRGGTAGGTFLTLTGTGFNTLSADNQVFIDNSECTVQSASETEITCTTSGHIGSGYFDIELDVHGVGLFIAPVQFRYVNAWSSPATWGCSTGTLSECSGAPVQGDLVEIGPGNDVLLDISTEVLAVLLIRGGSLTWDTEIDNIHLQAEYIILVDGEFTLGTESEPMMNQATITMYGHHRSIHLPIYGAKVFAVRSGTIDIHGAPVTPTWTFLESAGNTGDTSIIIQTPDGLVGWNVGDRIAIAPTGGQHSIVESEDVTIASITNNNDGTHTLGLDNALAFDHTAVESTWSGYDSDGNDAPVTLNQRAEVGILSRNIQFLGSENPSPWYDTIPECEGGELDLSLTGVQNCFVNRFNDEEGSDKFGAHMILHSITHAKIEYMEIHHCGQASELGRYPIHFHNSYDQHDSYFRGLGIWQTFNRAMTLHAVNYAMIENNVAYNNMGHAYFMEDAVEHDNTVRYNLAIKTKIASSLLSVDQTPASFWIVNMNNRYYGNRAAGSAGFGFWVNPPLHSTGSNVNNNFCPREIPPLEFRDNSAHSCGVYGMWIFEQYHPRKNNFQGDCSSTNGLAGSDHPLETFTSWGNTRGVEFTDGSGLHMKGFIAADNSISQLACKETDRIDNFEEDSTTFVNSVLIGRSNSHPTLGITCSSFGFETPWKKGSFRVNGAKFYNFDGTNDQCRAIDYCYGSYPFDCGRISLWERIVWDNSPRKGHFDWEFETVLWDLDGTLSETGNPNTKIVPKSSLNTPHCVDHINSGWDLGFDAQLCDSDAHYHRISIENIDPGSLNSVNLIVNNGGDDARVPWREKRGDSGRAWMYLNLMDRDSELHFDTFYNLPNITFSLKTNYDNPGHYSNLYFDLLNQPDLISGLGSELNAIPVLGDENYGYFIDSSSGGDAYIHLEANPGEDWGVMESRWFQTKKCWFPNCEVPELGNPNPPSATDIVPCNWSDSTCWVGGIVPGLDPSNRENVTILIDQHIMIDVADLYFDDLYVEGTLELDQSTGSVFTIEANNILVNTGYGGIIDFDASQFIFDQTQESRKRRSSNSGDLPEWQFGRFIIGTESTPIACDKTVTIKLTAEDASAREGWGAFSDSVPIGNKTFTSMGRLSLVGSTCGQPTDPNYLRLVNNAAAGDSSITVDAVPTSWTAGKKIVISPSGPIETEYETNVISSIVGNNIILSSALQFDHAGYSDNAVTGADYANSAEVGLLTRNIIIDGSRDGVEEYYGGRLLVTGAIENKIYRQGHATINNVQFIGMGQYGMSSLRDPRFGLSFYNIPNGNGKTAGTHIDDRNGNPYQPTGYDIGASYIRNCAFDDLYSVAIGLKNTVDIELSNNVIHRAIDEGILIGSSTGVTLNDNMVTGVIDNVFYKGFWKTQHNFDFDGIYMAHGVNAIDEVDFTSFVGNAVSGIQGAAFTILGEACSELEVDTDVSAPSAFTDNIGHSSTYGLRPLFAHKDDSCTRYSGFSFSNIMNCGFCSIVGPLHLILQDFEVQDTPIGVFFNNYGVQAVSHTTEDKTLTIKNSKFVAVTTAGIANNCNRDYLYTSANAPDGSMMEMWGQAHLSKMMIGPLTHNIGFAWTNLQGGIHSFPHKPFDKPTKNMVLYGRSYLNTVSFINYGNHCGLEHYAISNLPKQHDHHIQTDVSNMIWESTSNKLFLYEPKLDWINPADCVDMDCDGPKKAMLLDVDGSFSETGVTNTYMGVSELDYGVNGPRGLGNFRIPAAMLTDTEGSQTDPDVWAPTKGVVRTGGCVHDTTNHFYQCDDSISYMQMLYESMDVDTETRRVAPIAIMADGTVDIVNGVSDTSCCAGYACQLRQTTHPLIMACGREYELGTTGTLNKDFKLHTNRQDQGCKILLKIFTRRQNRQDVFIDGSLVPATNSILNEDGSLSFSIPTPADIPQIVQPVGTNFFDRNEQMLHVVVQGSSVLRIIVAKTLIVEFDSTATEMTAEELYNSNSLINYLATILGIDSSKIKVVNVVTEGARRRRKRRTTSGFIEHGRFKRSGNGNTIVLEIDNSNDVTSEAESVQATSDQSKLDANADLAEKIVKAAVQGQIPDVEPAVAIQTITPPAVPECMANEIAQTQNPENALDQNFIPGASCSLAAQYDVEPEDLESVADTNILPTYEEVQEAIEVKKEKKESLTRIVPPTEWNLKLGGRTKTIKEGSKLVPPIKLRLKDSDGAEIESAGFLDKTFEATVSIKTGDVTFDNDLTSQVINFDDNGDAVFDAIKFKLTESSSRKKRSINETDSSFRVRRDGDCGGLPCDGECVTVEIELTEPPLNIGGQEAGPYCVEAEAEAEESEDNNEDEESTETPCQFVTLYGMNSIYCSSNNMDTSNSLLLTTLNSMSVADLNAIQWLSINQNPGIAADNLNAIMAKLVNLERLSLNSNNLWKLNSDTFTFNAKLKSVSLHNNAISCLDGVFDNLIDNNILKRLRLTQNTNINDGWNAEYRYRTSSDLAQFKTLVNSNLCDA